MQTLVQVGLVAVGSAVGGLLRWGMGLLFAGLLGTSFPFGTFFINVTGSFFIGWFLTLLEDRGLGSAEGWLRADNLRLLVAVGFTGGFTTFSSFEFEADTHLRRAESFKAILYLAGSVLLGLLAVRLGVALAKGRWESL